MPRDFPRSRSVVLAFGMAGCIALLALPSSKADDKGSPIPFDTHGAYPMRLPAFEKWLCARMVPGRTTAAEVFSVVGTKYYHPDAWFDRDEGIRHSTFMYNLDDLGVRDHPPNYVLVFMFDVRSGALLYAFVGDHERQTGFNADQIEP